MTWPPSWIPADVDGPRTPPPESGRLELIRGVVREQVAETYP